MNNHLSMKYKILLQQEKQKRIHIFTILKYFSSIISSFDLVNVNIIQLLKNLNIFEKFVKINLNKILFFTFFQLCLIYEEILNISYFQYKTPIIYYSIFLHYFYLKYFSELQNWYFLQNLHFDQFDFFLKFRDNHIGYYFFYIQKTNIEIKNTPKKFIFYVLRSKIFRFLLHCNFQNILKEEIAKENIFLRQKYLKFL